MDDNWARCVFEMGAEQGRIGHSNVYRFNVLCMGAGVMCIWLPCHHFGWRRCLARKLVEMGVRLMLF